MGKLECLSIIMQVPNLTTLWRPWPCLFGPDIWDGTSLPGLFCVWTCSCFAFVYRCSVLPTHVSFMVQVSFCFSCSFWCPCLFCYLFWECFSLRVFLFSFLVGYNKTRNKLLTQICACVLHDCTHLTPDFKMSTFVISLFSSFPFIFFISTVIPVDSGVPCTQAST